MGFPADTYSEAVDLSITASNQLHTILNGDSTTEVAVEDGSKIPSVRKAYSDSLFFLPPKAWVVGDYETAHNQLRAFVEPTGITTWWFSKTATVSTPILMSTTPHEDSNWTLWNAINNSVYETQKRLAAEAGFNMAGSFLLGATVTTTDDVVFYETDGKYYGWGGTLPKTVPAGSTPATSGGVGVVAWLDVTNVSLRSELTSGAITVRNNKLSLRDFVSIKDFGAVGDGVTDDTVAIQNAINFGKPIRFTYGSFRLTSNITFSVDVTFEIGSSILIDSVTATVSFSKTLSANEQFQIFFGTGAVSGLREVHLNWFAGSKADNPATDALTEIQKAYNSLIPIGTIYWPGSRFYIDGTIPVYVNNGQSTIGVNRFVSQLIYKSTTANGFSVGGSVGSTRFQDIGVGWNSASILPVGGVAWNISSNNVCFDNVLVDGGFYGISCQTNSGGVKANKFDVYDCFEVGILVSGTNDVFFENFTIVAIYDRLTLSNVTGTFTTSDTITGVSSGATSSVGEICSPTLYRVQTYNKNFTIGETVVGSSSGATGVVVSQIVPHRLGGVRLLNKAEAVIFTDGDIIGGQYGLTTDATLYVSGSRPAYNKFTNVYFDSSDNGVSINNSVEFDFVSCWFSNRPNNGLMINTVENFRFNGGGAINSAKHGVTLASTSKYVFFSGGFAVSGNSTLTANTYDGFYINPNTSDFFIQGCRLGGSLSFGTQRYGVNINTGSSDRYVVADNSIQGNGTGGVSDSGTGTNKRVSNNY